MLVAEGLQVLGEARWHCGEGEGQRRDGGNGPACEGVVIEVGADVVEFSWGLLAECA